jgi:maltose alpha-D-glucosyltransferase/alpha-amylase
MAKSALATLESLSGDDLLAYLKRQRWFGAKGGSPTSARVADAVALPWGNGAYAIARVVVDLEGGARQTYQLPVSSRGEGDAVGGGLHEASRDDEFRRGLIDALNRGASAESNGLKWMAEPVGKVTLPTTSKVGSAEQSNTSIVIGDQGILKLFRLLRPGVQPDVEVTSFLTRAGFANTPKLIGTIRFERQGEVTVAGMVQQYLAGSSDAWSYALERARLYFTAPINVDPPNAFLDDAKRLGEVTRGLHEALAGDHDDPDFEPEAITPEDLDRWCHRTQHSIHDSLALLERQLKSSDFPADRRPEAEALLRRKDHFLGWIDEINDYLGDDVGLRIRVHGDYHLGQVLRTASNDFMIIDFEGEPSRPLEERREKTSPLRDVAGMLRSFAYAAATLGMEVGKKIDARTREIRMARWERDVRLAYLEGYLSEQDEEESGILPEDQSHIKQLIALFEAEKAFYELAYELNNRPAWAWIPMRGISKLFTA